MTPKRVVTVEKVIRNVFARFTAGIDQWEATMRDAQERLLRGDDPDSIAAFLDEQRAKLMPSG